MRKRQRPAVASRRGFLAAATVAAGATIVRPAAVRGSEANSKINIGCVGLGGRGHWIAGLFDAHGGYQITGCADYFPDVSKTQGQTLGVPEARCFSGLLGYQRLLATDIDAIVLETPTCFFPTHATASVAAGKHVYMAKPLATDVPGTHAIRAAGEKATKDGKVFLIDFQMRVNPYLMECVKRIREGKMNGLRFIRAFYDDEGREVPKREKTIANLLRELAWGMDVAIGGDRILVAGIHALDAALFLTNEAPVSCIGISKTVGEGANYDSADVYSLSYLFPSGCLMDFSSEYLRNYRGFNCGLEATGSQSYLESKYDGLDLDARRRLALQGRRNARSLHRRREDQYRHLPQERHRRRLHQPDGRDERPVEPGRHPRPRSRPATTPGHDGRGPQGKQEDRGEPRRAGGVGWLQPLRPRRSVALHPKHLGGTRSVASDRCAQISSRRDV